MVFSFGQNEGLSDSIAAFVKVDNPCSSQNPCLGLNVWIGGQQNYIHIHFNNANAWQHFAWTLSPSGTWTAYKNGVIMGNVGGYGQQVYPAAITRPSNYLGQSNRGDHFTGAIDDFRVYNTVLGAAEVSLLYGESTSSLLLL